VAPAPTTPACLTLSTMLIKNGITGLSDEVQALWRF